MPIDPNIAAGVKPIELENPLEQYARVLQIKGAQQSNALNGYKLDEEELAIKNRDTLNALYQKHVNPTSGALDYDGFIGDVAANRMGSSIPGIQKSQLELEKGKMDIKKDEMGLTKIAYDNMKTFADTVKERMALSRQRLDGVTTPQQFIDWHKANHKDPVLAEYFASIGVTPEQSLASIQQGIKSGKFSQMINESKLGADKSMEQKFTVINSGGKIELVATNAYGAPNPRVIKTEKVTPSPNKPVTHNSTTVVNIPAKVESKYGEAFGAGLGKLDLSLYEAARNAPELAERSDRILSILQSGKIITGSGADFQLRVAKALNLVGGNDSELIANTEVLAADLAKNTLGAIKTSGLGSGQGFTDKDREFLEKAVGGKISINRESLMRLTVLSRRSAEKSAENWNIRASQMPQSAVQGTRVPRVTLPKRPGYKTPVTKQKGKNKTGYGHLWGG